MSTDQHTGLNPHLLAKFFALKRSADGLAWETDASKAEISVPATQASMELAMNWQSPFEGAGVESRFPALAQMAQAGMFSGVLQAIGSKLDENSNGQQTVQELQSTANQLVGKTGVTKLNSTQVFSGMPPVKIQLSVLFKAFRSPLREVEEPIRALQEWSLPQKLAADGVIAELIRSGGDLLTLMPSDVPLCVGLSYKGRIFRPMVIESITDPLEAPIDNNGHRVSALIQLTLCSLTALDKADWRGTYQWQKTQLG